MSGKSVHQGFAGYLGANAGYTGSTPTTNAEGIPTSLKLLGSYVTPESSGVFDFGYGIQSQRFLQSGAVDGQLWSGVMELGARYQLANRLQIGGVYNQFFNKGVNYGSNQGDAAFGGAQLLKEFGFGENFLGRFGGRIMTSLNANNERVNMALLDFQVGWGGVNNSESIASTSKP